MFEIQNSFRQSANMLFRSISIESNAALLAAALQDDDAAPVAFKTKTIRSQCQK